jgi:carbon monoxide dehydrogenase subunit G
MTIIESSISISKPVEKVFEFITNFENQKVLNPSLSEVVVSGKLAVGTKIKYKGTVMGRAFEANNEIVALEPNKKLGIKTIAAPPASDVTNTFTLEKDGSGTKLHIAMDCVVFPGTEGMVVPSLKGSLDQTLAATKKALGG